MEKKNNGKMFILCALAHKMEQFMTNSIEMKIQIPREKNTKRKNLPSDFSIFNSRKCA